MTALAYFGPQFFKLLVGNDSSRSLLITGLFGAEKFITVGIYILFFSEMWGRKPTLWISALLMSVCFVIVTVVNNTTPKPQQEVTSAGIATVAMIFLTNSIYQFSWGPLPWPYTTEVRLPTFINHIPFYTIHPSTYKLTHPDLPLSYPRNWLLRRRRHTVALQLPLLPCNPLYARILGKLHLSLLRSAGRHHGGYRLVLRQRDQG